MFSFFPTIILNIETSALQSFSGLLHQILNLLNPPTKVQTLLSQCSQPNPSRSCCTVQNLDTVTIQIGGYCFSRYKAFLSQLGFRTNLVIGKSQSYSYLFSIVKNAFSRSTVEAPSLLQNSNERSQPTESKTLEIR